MNVTTAFPAGQTSRAQLKEKAEALTKQTLPYGSKVQSENSSFLKELDKFEGNTIADIAGNVDKNIAQASSQAEAQAAAASKLSKHYRLIGLASAGVGLGALVAYATKLLPGPALTAVATAAIAGEIYGGVKSTGADNQAANARYVASANNAELTGFKSDLYEWGQFFAAQG